jgi:serine/threonine protein kinase
MELAIVGARVADLPPTLIAAGDRVGPYEIVSLISRGGMGEVYRAVDTRLDRVVAIKLLSPSVVESVSRRDRFEREARAVSSLNHPHICALYDVGERDDTPFLVMEHVEGETLADRLKRGALPTGDVLRYSIEIAGALEHAHNHGIIHRDLKPANVMLTHAGVKLLDFGVAKLKGHASIGVGASAVVPPLETITEDGTVVGTLQYMAPEQLEARDSDTRTDIFAFGAVVSEMATGQRAFSGPNRASVMEAILNHDPAPCSSVNREAPAVLDEIVARCLAKSPDDRWQTASDLKHALAEIADASPPISGTASSGSAWRIPRARVAGATIAVIAILTAIALAVTYSRRLPADARALRFIVPPPENGNFSQSSAFMAMSPDGQSLAFVASSREGRNTLWVRSLDALNARPLPGTDDAGQPFWSSDGRFLAFGRTSGADTLNTIDVVGGHPQGVAGTRAAPGAWNEDDVILFPGGRQQGGLYRVSASGGSPTPVTSLDTTRGEISHAWPQFLPDGRRFIFLARSTQPEHDGVVYAGSLDSRDRVRLVRADSQAVYAPQGYLLYLRVNTLVAQPFDPTRLRVTGEPIPIAEQVERTVGTFRGAFSISRTGVLAYRPIGETGLAWYDRAGRQLQQIDPLGHYSNPALSPDEQRLAVGRLDFETGASDIWVMDLARGGLASRVTFDAAAEEMPIWRPDGSRLVFRTPTGLHERASSGSGNPELLLSTGPAIGYAQDWSHDGAALIYHRLGRETGLDIWMLPIVGSRTPVPLLHTPFQEGYARLSPDGRWMAYVSDESGRFEVYVRAFPSGEGPRQISNSGGLEPAWSGDGSELFYLAPDRKLMSVAVRAGSTFDAEQPTRLFETRMSVVFNPTYTRNQYAVSRDGQRLLINQTIPAAPPSPITVVVNWQAALKP